MVDRFGLIFTAVELERNHTKKSNLAKIDLGNTLKMLFPMLEQLMRQLKKVKN